MPLLASWTVLAFYRWVNDPNPEGFLSIVQMLADIARVVCASSPAEDDG